MRRKSRVAISEEELSKIHDAKQQMFGDDSNAPNGLVVRRLVEQYLNE